MNKKYYGKVIFELSRPGRQGYSLPSNGCDDVLPTLPAGLLRQNAPQLPEVDELTAVRHYNNMSTNNFGVDTGFYPLGSCTMKYNPKISGKTAFLPLFAAIRRFQPSVTVRAD